MKTRLILAVAVSVFALCGCQENRMDKPVGIPQSNFGEAVHHNIAAETVNPNAPSGQPPEASGAPTAIALDRYEHDQVKQPSSAGVGSSGGSTGMGSGGGTGGH